LRPIYLISKTPFPGVIHIPILKTNFLTPDIDFSVYDGLIVTSKQILKALAFYSEEWKLLPMIAVSEATAEVFKKAGGNVIAVANGYGEAIVPIVLEHFSERRWLYLRPRVVASAWVETAREHEISLDEAVMYETECNDEMGEYEISSEGVLIFTSPSCVECFCKQRTILATQKVVVIGTTTQKALPLGVVSVLSTETSVGSAVKMGRELAFSSPF
jgi:uroporphyrinogen-III synthase